jgi:hypothetical protein
MKNTTEETLFRTWKDKKLKSIVSFIQPKPMSDSFLPGFSLFSFPEHSLKVLLLWSLLLLNPMCLLKYCHVIRWLETGFELMTRFIEYSAWLHFTVHYYTHTHTSVHSTSSIPLFGSGFQLRTFPFLRVVELAPASATSFPHQHLTTTGPR